MTGIALDNIEGLMLRAAAVQTDEPHPSTLPPAGQHVSRTRVDESSGQKKTEWFGRKSFIADIGLPGRRVVRIQKRPSVVRRTIPANAGEISYIASRKYGQAAISRVSGS